MPALEAYVDALLSQKEDVLPALLELLRLQACSRCCLRFAGVRTTVYRLPAPSGSELGEAVAAKLRTQCFQEDLSHQRGSHLRPEAAAAGQASQDERLETGNSAESARLGTANGGAIPVEQANGYSCRALASGSCEPVCRICLGVLQSIDGPLSRPAPNELEALPEVDSVGVRWQPLSRGNLSTIAEHVRSSEVHYEAFALEISVPAAAQLRQYAMWHHLRSLPSTAELFRGMDFRDDAVDLKETLRLQYAYFTLADEILCDEHRQADSLLSGIHQHAA